MANSAERPGASPIAPDVKQPKAILEKLLAIELERLDVAVKIEKERKIVFPETSIIIRDIQKLQAAINGDKSENDWLAGL